jgi:hypothetical protein
MILDADLLAAGVAMVKKYLSEGIVEVTFTKADGNTRVMQCTTLANLIPEEKKPQVKKDAEGNIIPQVAKEKPVQLITAFDTEKNEWRSFNYPTIKAIKLHNQPHQA